MQDRAGMEGPGLSLFQGPEGIELNVSGQHLQEEEEQEDIKRRNEEVRIVCFVYRACNSTLRAGIYSAVSRLCATSISNAMRNVGL